VLHKASGKVSHIRQFPRFSWRETGSHIGVHSPTWLGKLKLGDFVPVRNDSKQREFVPKEIPEGDTMTQSVEELRRESERNREQLTKTVDQLRLQITDTAADIQSKVSPQHIKSEVSDFISSKTASWIDSLKQHAKENPMQAIAAGTAIAVPVMRMVRGFPLPLLMIGAGLALSSKNVRERAAAAAAPAAEKAQEITGDAMQRAQSLQGDIREAVYSARSKAAGMANEAYAAATGVADDIGNRAEEVAGSANDKLKAGMDAASGFTRDTIERVRATVNDAATGAPEKVGQAIGDNAVLIGSLGIAIGAIIAASLPATKVEASALGEASDGVRRAAADAAQSGLETAKDAAVSMVDAAAKSVAEADLGGHASHITKNMTGTLKEIADDVVKTALNPSRNQNT
jgi:hypothetical protein